MVASAILVLGATGRTGQLLVRELLDRGARVRALVRDAAAARTLLGSAVDLVEGDLRHADDLAAALPGCDRIVFLAAGTGDIGRGIPREIDFGAVAALVEAAASHPIARFILLSSAGVTQPEHPHNCSFNSVLKWKLRGEEALRRSGLPYTIVRALGLRDRERALQGVRLVQGDRIAFGEDIARADVAAFLADLVTGGTRFAAGFDPGSLSNATFEIFNDATLPGGRWLSAAAALRPDGSA